MSDPTPQMMALTNESFSEFVRTHRFAVIHFWAAWNGHDVTMRNLLESQIPERFRDLVSFACIDVDPPEHQTLCRQHNVVNVPFLAFYRDNSLVRSVVGLRPQEVIVEYLQDLIEESETN